MLTLLAYASLLWIQPVPDWQIQQLIQAGQKGQIPWAEVVDTVRINQVIKDTGRLPEGTE